ncbi:flagellin [Polycladidibacter hongkongensis]|uniref:flagellin N-terminal helical domain-containing protein n=1 Tax=Polycladidibacter hongkongensis TaxID=1647556 RepID=UPI00082D42FC|nr:flagellin [Pseudovibrio hongkongensis]
MADITLTAAVRNNLSTLQSTASMISSTQERLSTGMKVNSALDNPNSYFTAASLNNRASDLSNLQDDMGQSVSTLTAADKGIKAISKLVDAAKGKANQALQSEDKEQRAKYSKEFNDLRTQIQDLAKDSGYKGKNLLGGDGNDLKVKFNEDGTSKLDIKSVDFTDLSAADSDLKLGAVQQLEKGDFTSGAMTLGSGTFEAATKLDTLDNYAAGGKITIKYGSGDDAKTKELEITADNTVGDLAAAIKEVTGEDFTIDGTAKTLSGKVADDLTFSYEASSGGETGGELSTGDTTTGLVKNGWSEDAGIEASLETLKTAQDSLRAQASTFGTNLSVVQNRKNFTADMINTLEVGAGKLTLADTNKEGANLAALQTQQQLATSTLALAARANQSVLQLIR